jgi:hypothetical protein
VVAEDVAKIREVRFRDRRNEAVDKKIDPGVWAIVKLARDDMGAEERADDVERLFVAKFIESIQDFQFVLPVQAVAAFCLQRGCAVCGEFAEKAEGALLKNFWRCAPQGSDCRLDPAAALRDFLVGCAGNALLVFRGAAGGENQMCVRIDEARQYDAAAKVEFFGAPRVAQSLHLSAWANGLDAAAANEQGAVADDVQVAER